MDTLVPHLYPERSFSGFELVSFGEVSVLRQPMSFGFQVDIVPSEMLTSHVLFGLVTKLPDAMGEERCHGFAVRLDLETGEIWDMVNGSGLVAWMDSPRLNQGFSDVEPMLLSWKVEHVGNALIPRLEIGGEEWLYPAVQSFAPMSLDTLAGCAGAPAGCALTSFLYPAVWQEMQERKG